MLADGYQPPQLEAGDLQSNERDCDLRLPASISLPHRSDVGMQGGLRAVRGHDQETIDRLRTNTVFAATEPVASRCRALPAITGQNMGDQAFQSFPVVVLTGHGELIENPLEDADIDGARGGKEDAIDGSRQPLLLVIEQLLVQLLAGAQADDLYFDVEIRPQAGQPDQPAGDVDDLDRVAHVEDEDPALASECSMPCAEAWRTSSTASSPS